MAKKRGPDEEDFSDLATNVQQFATCLLDPLKADDGNRLVFASEIESFADEAIEKDEKKVSDLEFPVVLQCAYVIHHHSFCYSPISPCFTPHIVVLIAIVRAILDLTRRKRCILADMSPTACFERRLVKAK